MALDSPNDHVRIGRTPSDSDDDSDSFVENGKGLDREFSNPVDTACLDVNELCVEPGLRPGLLQGGRDYSCLLY